MHVQRLHQLFDELNPALVLYARQWCEYPDDAVQEAFIDLAQCEDEPESPKAWLYTTTRRKAQNIARSENRRRYHQQQASETVATWFSKTSNQALLAEDVAHGLESLDSDERELVVARIWGELHFEQLAELLGCSVSSAHRRYNAALLKLKKVVTHTNASQQASCAHSTNTPHRPSPLPMNKRIQNRCQSLADATETNLGKLDTSAKFVDGESQ